jgi:ankyrin repeat protein
MSLTEELIDAFETHSPDAIRQTFRKGINLNAPINGKRPVDILIEMYTRSPRFRECLQVMIVAGAGVDDQLLQTLLLDHSDQLKSLLTADQNALNRMFHLNCAYTSLDGVSALHICAEYNCSACARVLLDSGMDVDLKADIDADGIGGQTPLFHCVNSNRNFCRPMMELLANAGARLDNRVQAVAWGRGHDWETVLFDVTPISYAQCGLLPQFHRREEDILRKHCIPVSASIRK